MGYYIRWTLMKQWARAVDTKGPDANTWARPWDETLIIDSDRERDRPMVPFCANTTDGGGGAGRCLPDCATLDVRRVAGGACHGHYAPADVLLRSRFALCLRGDIPTSARPYDAIRYGSIPLLVSDNIWRTGLPFQCWVPWALIVAQISEASFQRDAAAALRNAMRLPHAAEARMRELIAHFGRDVLWRHPQSRVAENVLLAARRWQLRRRGESACCPIEDAVSDILS